MSGGTRPAGRQLWAGLDLLDHQIVDPDGRMAGKVDDLEFEIPDGPGALPELTALRSGLGALAGQLGGRLGRWLQAVERRLAHETDEQGGGEIGMGLVASIGEHVEVVVSRTELASNRGEAWVRDVVIGRIPGASHEAE